VSISSAGVLHLVPFAALVDHRREYLAKRFEITYLTSGRDLLRFTSAGNARGDPVVVADPDFGQQSAVPGDTETTVDPTRSGDLDRGGWVFEPLAGTAAEAHALRVLLEVRDENLLMGANATEGKLKQLHGPRILHVATPGFFLSDKELEAATPNPSAFVGDAPISPIAENPLLRSGLALAGANAAVPGTTTMGS
jgi:CHAT domain-containing protein